jgi:hypothetical protein
MCKRQLVFLFCVLLGFCKAQRIMSFNVYPYNNAVTAKFTIKAGSQCTGFQLQHGTDSLNMITVYDFPGVCGDFNANTDYSATHNSPLLNQINYYRIQLQIPFENSSVRAIQVGQVTQSNMYAFPNPMTDGSASTLKFRLVNVNNLKVAGRLFTQGGLPLREVVLITKGEIAEIDISDLREGLYVLWLTDGNQVYYAKFVIAR